jgi:hypothetical protein
MERHYYNILMRKLFLDLYFINILRIFQNCTYFHYLAYSKDQNSNYIIAGEYFKN